MCIGCLLCSVFSVFCCVLGVLLCSVCSPVFCVFSSNLRPSKLGQVDGFFLHVTGIGITS